MSPRSRKEYLEVTSLRYKKAPRKSRWRGLGLIPDSGYRFKESYKEMDVRNVDVEVEPPYPQPCKPYFQI